MSRNYVLLGVLAVLLLAFGCTGNTQSNPPAQSPPAQTPPAMGSGTPSNIQLGDSDISPDNEPNENLLSTQDVAPADNSTVANAAPPSTNTGGSSGSNSVSDSDLSLNNDSGGDPISQGDVVEPG